MKSFLYALCLVTAVVFVILIPLPEYPFSFVLKAIPALSLSVLAFQFAPHFQGKMIGLGLLFGAGGDVALELDAEKYFVVGLGLFLVNHICFILAFASERDPKVQPLRKAIAIVMVVFGILAFYVLQPRLGELMPPVLVYLAVITIMGVYATMRKATHNYFIVGAALFMISDSTIAFNKFLMPFEAAPYVIMITYYTAQFCTAHGAVLRNRR